jgi:uncharacterized membrane protein
MYQEMMQTFRDPHALHAMLVHIPLALAVLGLLPLAFLAATKFKSGPLKLLCIAWFLIASGGAFMAANTGEEAEDGVEAFRVLTPEQSAAMHDHEELGENGWIWALIPAGLVAATFVPKRRIAVPAGILAMVAAGGVTVWAVLTGHAGGRLVYIHGLGVPSNPAPVRGLPGN